MKNNFLQFKKVWHITPTLQIILISALFIATALIANLSFRETGSIFGYPSSSYLTILFAPIYEEILFRGVIFAALLKKFTTKKAIIYASILFGLWHLKNIFFLDQQHLASQMLYTGIIFAPIMCYITYKTKTIWIATILHYTNNLVAFVLTYWSIDWGIVSLFKLLQ